MFYYVLPAEVVEKAEKIRKGLAEGKEDLGKKNWAYETDKAMFSYEGSVCITTLEDAIQFANIDLDVWEVDRFETTSWDVTMKDPDGNPLKRTNYRVNVKLKKREFANFAIEQFQELVSKRTAKYPTPKKKIKGKKGVVAVADFHMGANITNLMKSPDFTYEVLVGYLRSIVIQINSMKYSEVHLKMLGDFIESFTGLNHDDVWKNLAYKGYGMNVVIGVHELLCEEFYSKINNLTTVDFVSGNHDRTSTKNTEDTIGEVALMIQYLFNKDFGKKIKNRWHPLLTVQVVDDICYISTHGHHKFSDKEMTKVLFDYGIQGVYNVIIQGHKHTREVIKSYRKKLISYEDQEVVVLDQCDYRKIVAPPLFTGNFWSEANGWSSAAGLTILESNGKGKINHFDYCL